MNELNNTNDDINVQNKIAMIMGIALKSLSSRVVTILCILLNFSMFMWVIYDPSYQRIISSSIFAVFSLFVLRNERKVS